MGGSSSKIRSPTFFECHQNYIMSSKCEYGYLVKIASDDSY